MRDTLKYMVLVLVGCLLASCSIFDEGSCPNEAQHKVTLTLALDSQSGTRTTWGNDYEGQIGDSFENRIDLNSLSISIFTTENVKVGDVADLVYWSTNANNTEYKFMGDISHLALTAGTEYKIMAFANSPMAATPEAMTFSIDQLNPDGGSIPFWGVHQKVLTLATMQDIGTIHMLRAAAKVEVEISDALGYNLTEVTINRHNTKGYSIPNYWNSVENTNELNYDLCMLEYRSVRSEPLAFYPVEEGKRYAIYLPEYNNILFSDYESKISLKLTHHTDEHHVHEYKDAISFKNYVDGVAAGQPYNIVRNHIYRFSITAIYGSNIELEYQVADWSRSDEWEWVQNFDYPSYHNPVLPDTASRDGDPSNDVYPDRPTMYHTSPNANGNIVSETGAFSCWFQMTAPVGQTWTPVVRGSANLCDIRVYKNNELVYTTESSQTDPSLTDGSKLVASSDWYNVKVIPTTADYAGVIEFGITYTQSWMGSDGTRYLMINGEADHIIWPNSGNQPRLIQITQVSN